MDGYYDPHPRMVLADPVVLAGHVGSGVPQVVRAMAARSGLPFVEVDRMLEAAEGQALGRISAQHGFAGMRALACQTLHRALRRRPCNLIVLGSPAIEAEELREALGGARLVYVQRPPEVLLKRLRKREAEHPGSLYGFPLGLPATEAELVEFLRPVEVVLQTADVLLEAGDAHPSRVATDLLRSLDRITGVERL